MVTKFYSHSRNGKYEGEFKTRPKRKRIIGQFLYLKQKLLSSNQKPILARAFQVYL